MQNSLEQARRPSHVTSMKISEADILIVPDAGNAGPGHWQHRWAERMNNAQWVEQEQWDKPQFDAWMDSLERTILLATRPVVLVGHSLGAVTIVHMAQKLSDTKVKGAFLVAPLDVDENRKISKKHKAFTNVPRDPLPFPSLMVASSDDDYCTIERAADLASAWGSEFHNAGNAGHINLASGHGPWPEGLMMFTRLMQRIKV
jgi:predicted alpha/beta hydrolase family esterase